MKKPFIRNAFQRERLQTKIIGDSMTQTQFQEETDINNIMEHYVPNGEPVILNQSKPNYGLADSTSFKEAMDLVAESQSRFNELPAKIRELYGNSPTQFMQACEKENQSKTLQAFGVKIVDGDESSLSKPAPIAPEAQETST
jgi:hypothetical protein